MVICNEASYSHELKLFNLEWDLRPGPHDYKSGALTVRALRRFRSAIR